MDGGTGSGLTPEAAFGLRCQTEGNGGHHRRGPAFSGSLPSGGDWLTFTSCHQGYLGNNEVLVRYTVCGRDPCENKRVALLLRGVRGLEKEVALLLCFTTVLCSFQKGGVREVWNVLGCRLEQLQGLLGHPCGAQKVAED